MMQQYVDIKRQYPDALLMFRLGDFYELFFDDAITASRALDITLTGRDAGSQGRVPMCGVPYHAATAYIEKLVDQGYCVAICEQTEDPKQAKGLVKREVVRIVTPGTVTKEAGDQRRILAALVRRRETCGLALADVATGDLWYAESSQDQLRDWLAQWTPAEILAYSSQQDWVAGSAVDEWSRQNGVRISWVDEPLDAPLRAERTVCEQFHLPQLAALELDDVPVAVEALAAVMDYLAATQKQRLAHLRVPKNLASRGHLVLDYTAQRNLELLESGRGRQKKGSLFGLLDATVTAMGARMLRTWIERPLADVAAIEDRLGAVQALVDDFFLRESIRETLREIYDLERLAGRLALGTANARDLRAVGQSLAQLPSLEDMLRDASSDLLQQLMRGLPEFASLSETILRTFVDQPPLGVREGGLIRDGVDAELDRLRTLSSSGKEWLTQFEQQERERTGIRSLKVGYNKVFGYYIEVSKANVHLVPDTYERRQTLAAAERYVVSELKQREAEILTAAERSVEREYELFCEVRDGVVERLTDLQRVAERIAVLDALCSMATVSAECRFTRPVIRAERGIFIQQGRHPVVESAHPGTFVPNDVRLGDDADLLLITGPNMAGKSTYMRQTALIVLMAHMGCFVPAESAVIGLVDRIFTRIGASDNLAEGQSTFMVEMVELAQILRQATNRSLVLLDEIGRGTSTYDGMSIAEAVMEALLSPDSRPLTLFATHYHELTEKADSLDGAANCSVLVRESPDGITFMHTVVPRPADKSYGIQVAKLAGIPDAVIERAAALLKVRETAEAGKSTVDAGVETAAAVDSHGGSSSKMASPDFSLPLFAWRGESVLQALAELDVNTLTPVAALNELHNLVEQAREVLQWDKSKYSRQT